MAQGSVGDVEMATSFGVGARALGMGGAYVALPSHYAAPYWNPAAMAQAERFRVGGMYMNAHGLGIHQSYLGGITALHLGLTRRLTAHAAAGVGFADSRIIGIETFGTSGDSTGSTSDIESLLIGSFAGGFDIGLAEFYAARSFKYYSTFYLEDYTTGWSADYGVFVEILDKVRIGGIITDPGDLSVDLGRIPTPNRVGMSLPLFDKSITTSLQLGPNFRFGLEFRPMKAFASDLLVEIPVRIGARARSDSILMTFGLGFGIIDWLDLDIAFVPNQTLGDTYVISGHANF